MQLVTHYELLESLNYDRLDVRRKVARLCFLRGVMVGSVDDAETLAMIQWHVPRRGGRASRTLYLGHVNTAAHATSHLISSIALFNSVAAEVNMLWSSAVFKNKCLQSLRNHN